MITFLDIKESEDKSSSFANRIRKNYRHIRKWAKKSGTNCFRIYDRDIKEYPFAIDYYAGRFCAHYFLPSWEQEPSLGRIKETNEVICSLFGIDETNIFWKNRQQREKLSQYEKIQESDCSFIVQEYGVRFKVNLSDYLDTGLFLDHRETRRQVALQAQKKRLLNLFAYTCSFSVHAAHKGAAHTKSVDMSNTYTEWGKENFLLNHISLNHHEIIREDCLKFLEEEKDYYDIIVIDPPTISRSKKMDKMFDIQEDYIFLLRKSLNLLLPKGIIFFSTNARKFHFNGEQFTDCIIEEISQKTIPLDFHDHKIHRCWTLRKKNFSTDFSTISKRV